MEYTELEVWKETRALVRAVYDVTKGFPNEEQYGLIGQIRRGVCRKKSLAST